MRVQLDGARPRIDVHAAALRRRTVEADAIAAPLLLDEAERRAQTDSDNLSLIAMRWGADDARDDSPPSKRSDTLSDGEFSTQMDHALTLTDPKVNNRDLTDEEIERAIDEIQSTIKRYGGK